MSSSQETSSINMEESTTTEVNPFMARFKFNISANRQDNDYFETLDENFTSLLKKRGRLYLSTKLRNISSTKPILQYFSRKLADDLRQQEAENLTSASYLADIIPLGWNEDGPQPLKIIVESHDSRNKKKPKSVVYTGVFFSWQVDKKNTDEDQYDLPFLFNIGPQKLLSSVNNLFEEYFGCKIMPAVLSQHEIRWLMILVLHQMSQENIRSMHVLYQMQSNAMKMDLTFSSAVLKEIWTKIHDENAKEITFKEVCTLHNAFEEHVLETLRIDLSYFHLKRFSVNELITVDVSGKLHMTTGDVIDLVYRFLSKR